MTPNRSGPTSGFATASWLMPWRGDTGWSSSQAPTGRCPSSGHRSGARGSRSWRSTSGLRHAGRLLEGDGSSDARPGRHAWHHSGAIGRNTRVHYGDCSTQRPGFGRACTPLPHGNTMIRLLGCLCLLCVAASRLEAQGVRFGSKQSPDTTVALTFGSLPAAPVPISPWQGPASRSLDALLRRPPRSDSAAIACPMHVLKPRPSSDDAMRIVPPDSTVAPAINRAVVLSTCHNERFR